MDIYLAIAISLMVAGIVIIGFMGLVFWIADYWK